MRRRLLILPLLVLALIGFAAATSGCGEEETAEAKEGEPLELGDLAYSIQITRELNRFSPEDAAYLEGAPPLRPDQEYLGVFMQVTNEGEEAAVVPDPFEIVDTRGTVYEQVPLDNEWALEPGTPVAPGRDRARARDGRQERPDRGLADPLRDRRGGEREPPARPRDPGTG